MAEDAEALSGSLALFSDLTRVLLQDVRREAAASLEALVPHKITTLFGLITAGADLYRSLGVKTKSEAEAGEWDSFLKQVDDGLQASDGLLFGLGSSYAKVMRFGCLLQYSEYVAAGRDFPDVPPRLLEDIYQEHHPGGVSLSGSEAAAGPHPPFWMTALTRPCGRAGGQS
ncbi:unnamed protein product, partial [Menidia menidia]